MELEPILALPCYFQCDRELWTRTPALAPRSERRRKLLGLKEPLVKKEFLQLGKPSCKKSEVFLNIVQTGEGGQPMFKNYVGNCRVFWRSFNNMKFA